jgi:O-antigen/teichoic acid export membrane protein
MSALFTSIIRTEYSAVSSAISSVARLSLGVLLVYLGFGWLGAVMGIILSSLSLLALMLFFTSRELKRLGGTKIHLSLKALRESLRAGFVSWLPAAVALIGQQLSLLTVYGIEGGYETGIFFIAYAMFSIVYMLPNSFMLVLFPVLSGLEDERATLAYRALKFCLALASPSAVFLVLYSRFPLSLMPGGAYIPAAPTLTFLALSIVPLVLTSAVSNLVYASGSYGKALGIGLAINIPKVALCLELLPIYGQFGAALAFLAGSFVGLGAAICVSKMVGFHVPLGKIALAIIVPSAAGLPCFLLGLDWLIGGIIILLASLICYGRLGVVDRRDLAEIARGFASEKTVAKARARFSWLLRIMYGE